MDSRLKSIMKSVVWRIVGIFWLAGITWLFTRSWIMVSMITFIHHAIFLVVFYLHERIWGKVTIRPRYKYMIKAFTYEIVLGNVILGLITYLITGSIKEMTQITLVYIQSKIILYYIYDCLWGGRKF